MINRKTTIYGIVFILIAIVFFVVGLFIASKNVSFLNNSEKAEGTVIDLIKSRPSEGDGYVYSPEVSFTDLSGKVINFTSNVSSNVVVYKIGEKVPVLYKKENPQDAKVNTFFQMWMGTTLIVGMGLIFFLGGLFALIKQARKSNLKRKLLSKGTKISAKIISVEKPRFIFGFSYNPGQTYQIIAQWLNPTDNQIYLFKSEALAYDPENLISSDKEIEVYIDTKNPKKYYVDISTFPELGN